MLFALLCTDRPNASAIRQAAREAHLRYLLDHGAAVTYAGPFLDPDGQPCGSLLIVDVPDRAAAEAFAAADPYAVAGLFAEVAIHGHRVVARDGGLVG